jgi:hypothetical protein
MIKNLKNFDWKQFLLQRGEQIGLYVAAGIMVLMLFFGMRGVFSSGAGANANSLTQKSNSTRTLIQTSTPTEDQVAEIKSLHPIIAGATTVPPVNPETFRPTSELFVGARLDDTKRRGPQVKIPAEFATAVGLTTIRAYGLSNDMLRIALVVGAGTASAAAGGTGGAKEMGGGMGGQMQNMFRNMQKQMQGQGTGGGSGQAPPGGKGTGGPSGGMGGMMGMNMNRPMMPGEQGASGSTSGGTIKIVKIEELEREKEGRPAEDVLPLRVGVIVASFPYKQQLEEFQKALRFKTLPELFSHPESMPEFDGFEVQRTEVHPGKDDDWKDVDVMRNIKMVALRTGRRWEEVPPEWSQVVFPGLAMKWPLQFHEDSLPKPEDSLKQLKDTLAKLKEAKANQIVKPPNKFQNPDDIDPFGNNSGKGDASGGEGMPGVGSGGKGKMSGPSLGGLIQEGGTKPTGAPQGDVVPDYCLLRILDVHVQPGKTYKYKIRIKMTNPNYQRPDVAWPALAVEKEIKSDWVLVPEKLTVPPEVIYYAVDMKAVEPKNFFNSPVAGPNQVAVQAHRWLEHVVPDPASRNIGYPVGDWLVAERLLVTRGEFMHREARMEVPVWDPISEHFSFPEHKRSKKLPVLFGSDSDATDPLLLDFQGGEIMYSKFAGMDEDKPKYVAVKDKMPTELVILSPDGKLLVRDSDTDTNHDNERSQRVVKWKERIKEVQEKDKPTAKTGTPTNPFGPGGGGPGN